MHASYKPRKTPAQMAGHQVEAQQTLTMVLVARQHSRRPTDNLPRHMASKSCHHATRALRRDFWANCLASHPAASNRSTPNKDMAAVTLNNSRDTMVEADTHPNSNTTSSSNHLQDVTVVLERAEAQHSVLEVDCWAA